MKIFSTANREMRFTHFKVVHLFGNEYIADQYLSRNQLLFIRCPESSSCPFITQPSSEHRALSGSTWEKVLIIPAKFPFVFVAHMHLFEYSNSLELERLDQVFRQMNTLKRCRLEKSTILRHMVISRKRTARKLGKGTDFGFGSVLLEQLNPLHQDQANSISFFPLNLFQEEPTAIFANLDVDNPPSHSEIARKEASNPVLLEKLLAKARMSSREFILCEPFVLVRATFAYKNQSKSQSSILLAPSVSVYNSSELYFSYLRVKSEISLKVYFEQLAEENRQMSNPSDPSTKQKFRLVRIEVKIGRPESLQINSTIAYGGFLSSINRARHCSQLENYRFNLVMDVSASQSQRDGDRATEEQPQEENGLIEEMIRERDYFGSGGSFHDHSFKRSAKVQTIDQTKQKDSQAGIGIGEVKGGEVRVSKSSLFEGQELSQKEQTNSRITSNSFQNPLFASGLKSEAQASESTKGQTAQISNEFIELKSQQDYKDLRILQKMSQKRPEKRGASFFKATNSHSLGKTSLGMLGQDLMKFNLGSNNDEGFEGIDSFQDGKQERGNDISGTKHQVLSSPSVYEKQEEEKPPGAERDDDIGEDNLQKNKKYGVSSKKGGLDECNSLIIKNKLPEIYKSKYENMYSMSSLENVESSQKNNEITKEKIINRQTPAFQSFSQDNFELTSSQIRNQDSGFISFQKNPTSTKERESVAKREELLEGEFDSGDSAELNE